jgi:hypothetical protein
LVCGVVKKRPSANGGVEIAGNVALEREITSGRIECARRETEKSVLPLCRITARVASVGWWIDCSD